MTNKLAIMDLKDIRDYLIECHYNVEAIDYAIKALEQIELIKYEACWLTGNYEDAECYFCPHKEECSGYEGDDDDDE